MPHFFKATIAAFVLVVLATALPAHAGPLDTCWDNARNHPEASACLQDMLTRTDAEMMRTAAALRTTILLNPFYASRPALRDALLDRLDASINAFPAERKRWCTIMGDMLAPGNGTGDVTTDCMIRAARERIRDMQDNLVW